MFCSVSGNYVKKSGDVMTGDLDMGPNLLKFKDGSQSGAIRTADGYANRLSVRKYDDSDKASLLVYEGNFEGDINMSGLKTVDGVDISLLAFKTFHLMDQIEADVSHTGDTAETEMGWVNIPAGYLGGGGSIIFRVDGYCTGNNGNKNIRLKFHSDLIYDFLVSASASTVYWSIIAFGMNDNIVDLQHWNIRGFVGDSEQLNKTGIVTNQDTSVGKMCYVYGQLVNADDVIHVRDLHVSALRG